MTKQTTTPTFKSFHSLKEAVSKRPNLLWKRHHMPTGTTRRPQPIQSKENKS